MLVTMMFTESTIDTGEAQIFVAHAGSGPPLALLHGFPETHLMWREIAPELARTFTVVMMDLRGYGESSCPPSAQDHSPYSKRSLGQDVLAVMKQLGHHRFSVVGHDRGGRVAYRLALDHPDAITRLVVLDVLVGIEAWERADARMMVSFWPWSLLAQPAPLPELVLERAAAAIVDDAAAQWGTPEAAFPADIRYRYAAVLSNPEHAHAICEEYRAAATIDQNHDAADRRAGRTIRCPTLVLWAAESGLDYWYDGMGGPLGIWRRWAADVTGEPLTGGHFFPEANSVETTARLRSFLASR
jgi:haloacetate dehalogenase